MIQAKCRYTRTAVITTNIAAGSLEAFATYLHSVGDSYSHLDCITAMDAQGYPWATHTLTDTDIPECYYRPSDPQDNDVHGREFYTYTDSLRTDAAIRAIYAELVSRSLRHDGVYYPIGLDTAVSGTQTLSDTLSVFVHQWKFSQPAARRDYADQLAVQVLASRQAMRRVYLPIIRR